jgi:membrane protease YdiL (CAAX protease family)
VAPRAAANPVTLVRRFPLASFVLLACLFGWSPFLITFLTGGSDAENFPLGPVLATLVVVSCQGRDELRAWGRKIRNWRAAPRWYALALLAPMTLQVLIVLANHAWWGAPMPTGDQLADWPQAVGVFIMMLIFVGIGEETGWMAFAAPILLRRHGLLLAWALSAGIRILWHLPMMLAGDLTWTLGVFGNAAFTMVMLQLMMASHGRWSLVAVWHAMLNATGGLFFFKMVVGDDRAQLGFLLAAIYAVLAVAVHFAGGRHLVWRDDLAQPGERVRTSEKPESPRVPHLLR